MTWIDDQQDFYNPNDEDLDQPTVMLTCEVKQQTKDAVLLKVGDQTEWCPRSLIEEPYTDDELIDARLSGSDLHVTIPQWLAEQKGLA